MNAATKKKIGTHYVHVGKCYSLVKSKGRNHPNKWFDNFLQVFTGMWVFFPNLWSDTNFLPTTKRIPFECGLIILGWVILWEETMGENPTYLSIRMLTSKKKANNLILFKWYSYSKYVFYEPKDDFTPRNLDSLCTKSSTGVISTKETRAGENHQKDHLFQAS